MIFSVTFSFLIIDKEEKLVDLYYEYILKNEDDNIAKDMEILFSSFYSELRENQRSSAMNVYLLHLFRPICST